MGKFERHKVLLNQELERFSIQLGEILPRYIALMKKRDITDEELKELGELEHFLIEINAKLAEIKTKLDHDLFGEAMDEYYRVKQLAINGDADAKRRFDKLRKAFLENVKGETFFIWN